jgi:hypothetical protein
MRFRKAYLWMSGQRERGILPKGYGFRSLPRGAASCLSAGSPRIVDDRKLRASALIRIAVSSRAYRAIKATLPAGSVVYPPERNDRGQYLLWLNDAGLRRCGAMGNPTATR